MISDFGIVFFLNFDWGEVRLIVIIIIIVTGITTVLHQIVCKQYWSVDSVLFAVSEKRIEREG